ncbi:MAG: 30S ribosomal protein S2 [Elusimicrobia bacterium]|nr:30S ribosomal protein S2 [Elusimicrobiota bacterium]
MQQISIKAMLEAGAHFGHQTRRWNPKMAKYIYGSRNNIHIIDLQKSAKELKRALRFAEEVALKGGKILFVGTKRQAQETVKAEAQRCGEFYVTSRWIGGTLTNFATVRKSIDRLLEMEKMLNEGILDILNKKEGRKFTREFESLKNKYEGVKLMRRIPDALFIVDTTEEVTATNEAQCTRVPIVGICDTNADPDLIDFPIPGNDDALRSIRFFTQSVAQAVIDAKARNKPPETAEAMAVAGVAADSSSSPAEVPVAPAPGTEASS